MPGLTVVFVRCAANILLLCTSRRGVPRASREVDRGRPILMEDRTEQQRPKRQPELQPPPRQIPILRIGEAILSPLVAALDLNVSFTLTAADLTVGRVVTESASACNYYFAELRGSGSDCVKHRPCSCYPSSSIVGRATERTAEPPQIQADGGAEGFFGGRPVPSSAAKTKKQVLFKLFK